MVQHGTIHQHRYGIRFKAMLHNKKIVVVMPAYRAEKTLEECYRAIPLDVVDEVLLVDDASDDATLAVAARLGIRAHRHPVNRATRWRSRPAPTSSSCCIRIINTSRA
jgi:glycosyltransferase involved in cell wall biosynthesis